LIDRSTTGKGKKNKNRTNRTVGRMSEALSAVSVCTHITDWRIAPVTAPSSTVQLRCLADSSIKTRALRVYAMQSVGRPTPEPPTTSDRHPAMSLTFEVFNAEAGAFCCPGEEFDALLEDFDSILDAHQTGQLADKPYLAALDRLLAAAPYFVDVYAHIASHWHRQGKPKKALDAALLGLSIANRHIPEGFSGTIEWGHLDNRPYLRAMHIALLSYMRLRRHRDAVTIIELMLARNPNDHQGVRYLLGSELLRSGEHERARTVFEEEADNYPPYFYELALSYMLKDEWVAAATALRRGFVANPYIAECMAGNLDPAPLAIWHGTSMADPETARDYFQDCGALWHMQPDSFAFTRWLFNHPKVMVERAAIMECQEAMQWEDDATARTTIMNRARRLIAKINDGLSVAIVTMRSNRRKQMVWPWAHNS
jgi:tetratricopeptide (TPR) repeat protein